ncbi:rfaE bifunctional protein, domain II [Saccharopolyspora kobensis]|uniref:RfaE bifunctional protein, domain II n=2 Tax=Saccharopolyspora kobensis TaxID=146035 RepID=A0A1H6AEU7_9PSEU|nr:PfkB family carbohydrate kinase [Saccharopolyspora kobensis]SEG46694.1 rfaE bifunctional protein, domain II [Saccharopolyspora kobensis]SFE55002.1 rfaE bifunctional protein, domain II [Saccharopolyspora kobensis]
MKLAVVGDALLDVDLSGGAERLCPDAPVPVVDVAARKCRPGGAALAAVLGDASGADVTLITGRSDDSAGRELDRLLAARCVLLDAPFSGGTPSKTRVRADGQSLVRLDVGDGMVPDIPLAAGPFEALRSADAVLVADYGRGITRNSWLRRELARLPSDVPLVWDPHPRGAEPVPRTDLVVPNHAEALSFGAGAGSAEGAEALRLRWSCGAVAVTMGARGAVVSPPGEFLRAPELVGRRPDVCGAGDSFAVSVTLALGRGVPLLEAARYGVDCASRFVAEGGAGAWACDGSEPPPPRPGSSFSRVEQVRSWGGRVVAAGGCFDLLHPGHINLLNRARSLGDALVVCMNSDESVRRLKGPPRPVVHAEDRRCLLEALECVDAVAEFDETSPSRLLEQLRPDIWVKGGDYEPDQLPEARVVERHGGRTVLVPLVDGYSTSRILRDLEHGSRIRRECHGRAG